MRFNNVARTAYRGLIGAATLALPSRARDGKIAISYGGARSGDVGGALVKVRLLKSRFPEHRWGFSLVYILSNAIYVSQCVLDRIKSL